MILLQLTWCAHLQIQLDVAKQNTLWSPRASAILTVSARAPAKFSECKETGSKVRTYKLKSMAPRQPRTSACRRFFPQARQYEQLLFCCHCASYFAAKSLSLTSHISCGTVARWIGRICSSICARSFRNLGKLKVIVSPRKIYAWQRQEDASLIIPLHTEDIPDSHGISKLFLCCSCWRPKKNRGRLNVQNHSGLNGSQGSGEKLRKPGCVEVLFCNSLTAHTSANPAASCELPQKKTLISSS